MDRLDDLATIDLPNPLGQQLIAGARCEAVIVEAAGAEAPAKGLDRSHGDVDDAASWVSASVFPVGDAYVVKVVGVEGGVRTVGIESEEAAAFVDHAMQDDGLTVLSTGDASSGHERRIGGPATADR